MSKFKILLLVFFGLAILLSFLLYFLSNGKEVDKIPPSNEKTDIVSEQTDSISLDSKEETSEQEVVIKEENVAETVKKVEEVEKVVNDNIPEELQKIDIETAINEDDQLREILNNLQ